MSAVRALQDLAASGSRSSTSRSSICLSAARCPGVSPAATSLLIDLGEEPPDGPPPGYNGGQARWEMSKWRTLIDAAQRKGGKPIVLHDCHNGCGSTFAGPTLAARPCPPTCIPRLLSGGSVQCNSTFDWGQTVGHGFL